MFVKPPQTYNRGDTWEAEPASHALSASASLYEGARVDRSTRRCHLPVVIPLLEEQLPTQQHQIDKPSSTDLSAGAQVLLVKETERHGLPRGDVQHPLQSPGGAVPLPALLSQELGCGDAPTEGEAQA